MKSKWKDYQLLDSGQGQKLEQFGPYRLVRPEPRAVWKKASPLAEWQLANAEFVVAEKGGGGQWYFREPMEKQWQIAYGDLACLLEIKDSKQVGVFPENALHWDWIREQVSLAPAPLAVLNLFGYTGMASLAAAKAGAKITHIDASKRAIQMGMSNQSLSQIEPQQIRWLVDDAFKFVEKEIRRGQLYDALIMDPPKYGLGPKKERWEFFKHFEALCSQLRRLLRPTPNFVVVTAYAIDSPPEILRQGMERLVGGYLGRFEYGELCSTEQSAGRKISHSIYARWERMKNAQ